MQTFLPYSNFKLCASVLDYRRLNKQRLETKQILLALRDPEYGWQNHPAVTMWRGYEDVLIMYGIAVCEEWINRGYNDNVDLLNWFKNQQIHNFALAPKWLGNPRLHSSHRATLLAKDYNWYSRFNWREQPVINYYWPNNA